MKNFKRVTGLLLALMLCVNSFALLASATQTTIIFDRDASRDINNITFQSELTDQFLYSQDKWDTSIGLTSYATHSRNRWNIEYHGKARAENDMGVISEISIYKIKNTKSGKYITVREMKDGAELKQSQDLDGIGGNLSQLFKISGIDGTIKSRSAIITFDDKFIVTADTKKIAQIEKHLGYANVKNLFQVVKH